MKHDLLGFIRHDLGVGPILVLQRRCCPRWETRTSHNGACIHGGLLGERGEWGGASGLSPEFRSDFR